MKKLFDKATFKAVAMKFAIVFALFFSFTIGCALAIDSLDICAYEVSASIMRNNKESKYGRTYWGIKIRDNVKTTWVKEQYAYTLQGFAGTWHSADDPKNLAFIFNDSMKDVAIANPNNSSADPMPIKVIADPYRNTFSNYGFKLKDGVEYNSYHNFYCSPAVSEYLGGDVGVVKVDNRMGKTETEVKFSGVVESFNLPELKDIVGDDPYIVVPGEGTGFSGFTCFENSFVGDAKFVMMLGHDKYQNEFALDRVNYFVYREKFSKTFIATFVDNPDHLVYDFANVRSTPQSIYASYGHNMYAFNFDSLFLVIGAVLIAATIGGVFLLIKFNWLGNYDSIIHYCSMAGFLVLALFWGVGQLLYFLGSTLTIWSSLTRIVVCLINIVFICTIILISLIKSYRTKKQLAATEPVAVEQPVSEEQPKEEVKEEKIAPKKAPVKKAAAKKAPAKKTTTKSPSKKVAKKK